ncbi:unnamed protein product [Dovyalis caffra]|uniref:Uncharacterized protein n=1 Tax=Dovyalis caffra TaxID=77055 RepID=A0AAV1SNP8_9ROSI|nr:unnamed protein product [Dovyalis caffra]
MRSYPVYISWSPEQRGEYYLETLGKIKIYRCIALLPKPENVEEFQNFPGEEGIQGKLTGKMSTSRTKRLPTEQDVMSSNSRMRLVGYLYRGAIPVGIFSASDRCGLWDWGCRGHQGPEVSALLNCLNYDNVITPKNY